LAILWNPANIYVSNSFTTFSTLTAHYTILGMNQDGDITNVYGPQGNQDKDKFMEWLKLIKTLISTPN
jgi:hypothetical protein